APQAADPPVTTCSPADGTVSQTMVHDAGRCARNGALLREMTTRADGVPGDGLADARHLVELLGTGDTVDPEIGDRVFKTRSSEDLSHLNRIVEWAKASRLVRVSGTRLMAVKKNAALAERPLDLVLALLEAYPRLGKSLFPRYTWRQSLVGGEFTDISQELTTALLRGAGPCPLDELSDTARNVIEARYMLTD